MNRAPCSTAPVAERSARANAGAAVAIVGSAGAIAALRVVLDALPPSFPFPIVVAQHLAPALPSVLPEILGWRSRLRVKWVEPTDRPTAGIVHVAPPGCGVAIGPDGFTVWRLPPFARAWLDCPDRLLQSVADRYQARAVGIVLSGSMTVGIAGLRAIGRQGGLAIAQDRRSSPFFDMPAGAIDLGRAEVVLPPAKIAEALLVLAEGMARAA